ncbi:hypothetical protein KEG38_06265 [Polyangium jinanense]|uniref:hypothetical protein n=1 Tax=Polyangium jinanense TaxID=2829994 RepID=UPI002341A365|nr:hypothetical protein [Polyangium jinanense]MDC3953439.1 hypothetical protein [Polyangium jinanense]
MKSLGELVRDLQPHSLLTLSDQLVYVQSHHHGIFLDQTISDALGGEGWAVRKQSAFESSHALLEAVFKTQSVEGAKDRLEVASALFSSMGHGKLVFDVAAEGGVVRGEALFYGSSFASKYGKVIRHKQPVDSFAAGFSAAAASLAFPSDWGHFEAEEVSCVGRGDGSCAFTLSRRPERPRLGVAVTRQVVASLPLKAPPLDAPASQYPQAIPSAMRVIRNLVATEEGVVRAFGVRLAIVPVGYVNQITFDTMHLLESRTPELVPVYAALVREAAQSGAFHLLGGVLSSPEWAISSKATGPVEHRLEKFLSIARVLGWGRWYSVEFFPGQSLVVRSPTTQESIYYGTRYGASVRNRLFFQQGAVLAVMQLLHRVDFAAPNPISAASYAALFGGGGGRFHVEETRSPLRGDDMCEIVVEALSER